MRATKLLEDFKNNQYNNMLLDLYADDKLLDYQNNRFQKAISKFIELYGDNHVEIYSGAGRSEVGGNHTDHQHGCVLAASINLDAIGIVSKQEHIIKIVSDEFDINPIDIYDLDKRDEEEGTSEGLIRGVVYRLKELGYNIGGFHAFITSDVLMGAGLSSSASFETPRTS